MRCVAPLLAVSLAVSQPVQAKEETARLGLQVVQDGVLAPLVQENGAYVAVLSFAPFAFALPQPVPDVLGVTFGGEDMFALLEQPPESGLFGPGTGYARELGLDAAHFMTDPLCASPHYGPGFNYLDADRQSGGVYPVAAIHTDSTSRGCVADGRLPSDTNLIGRVNPLHVVVRVGDVTETLILRFVSS